MSAVELLRGEADQIRNYRSRSNYFRELQSRIGDFQSKHPGIDWSQCCQLVDGIPGKTEYQIAVKHAIKWGAADASVMEKHWGIKLPDWMHDFYSQVSEGIFTWGNLFQLHHPLDVIKLETLHRSSEGALKIPVRLIRFITIWSTADCFALMKNPGEETWQITYAALDDGTQWLQEQRADPAILDKDLEAWFSRMIATDALPVQKVPTFDERVFMNRVS